MGGRVMVTRVCVVMVADVSMIGIRERIMQDPK